MASSKRKQLVFTIPDRCRVCYTCVRECPVKAIKIINGQAEVISERCIGCGNCVKVCSQGAKAMLNQVEDTKEVLNKGQKTAAILAPSFPAEFTEFEDFRTVVGMVRALGFDYVGEVSFGADLVAREYEQIIKKSPDQGYISSDCPAIAFYIEHYHPMLTKSLVPVASPMVAMARVMKAKYGEDLKIVFIGPCIAKKAESDEVDEVLTFRELRELFEDMGIHQDEVEKSDFDPPYSGMGAIFPVTRGMLQTIDMSDDIFEGNIVVAEGRINFRDAVKEYENGLLQTEHLELLCCEGCIMGPGMSPNGKRYARRSIISNYVKEKLENLSREDWERDMEEYSKLDLSVSFRPSDRRMANPDEKEIEKVLQQMGKHSVKDHLNCGACGYDTCEEHAIAVVQGLAEYDMCLPNTIEKLHQSVEDLNLSNEKLASVQQALKQSEKLAHMGQLSAGIAHELNNPLGVVMMYSNILLDELGEEDEMSEDLKLIVEQAERCKRIVGNLLNFARKNQVRKEEVSLVKLVKNSLNSVIVPNQVKTSVDCPDHLIAMLDYEQMMQVLTNLNKNAIDAMPEGGMLSISVTDKNEDVQIVVKDSGTGISEENMSKLFTPFFTTKGIGKGTGLGLATTYGIVKMHKGKIEVESNTDKDAGPTGTRFILSLPKQSV